MAFISKLKEWGVVATGHPPSEADGAGALRTYGAWTATLARLLSLFTTSVLLLVAAAVTLEIITRTFFHLSVVGVGDMSGLLVAVAIAAAFPALTVQKGHLVIELLQSAMGKRASEVMTYLGAWFLFAALALLSWRIGVDVLEFAELKSESEVAGLPLAPFFGFVTFFIAVAAFLQLVIALRGSRALFSAEHRDDTSGVRSAIFVGAGVLTIFVIGVAVLAGADGVSWLPKQPLLIALILFGVMWAGGLLMLPLGAVMLLTAVAGLTLVVGSNAALTLVATRSIELLSSDILLIIPLFLLMGTFAQTAGLSSDMFRLVYAILGHLRGGLALATIGACAGFGAMTGSSMATSLTIGKASYPEMRKYGYSEELSTGSIAAGGTLGQIVPPSAVLVIYAILTETSVGALFIAAAIPAVLVIGLFILTVFVQVRLSPQSAPEVVAREPGLLVEALKGIWPSLSLIVVVLGGIYVGFFTVTEAASVGALGAFLLAWFRGRLGRGVLIKVMLETAERTAMIYALIIGGSIFAFFIGVTELPTSATEFLASLNLPGLAVVAVLLVLFILLGMVMEAFAILLITVPVVAPIIESFGFDLIWWGIIMVMVVEIGLLTPPFGMNCFILKSIAPEVPLATVFKGIIPFVLADFVALALFVIFPAMIVWLPGVLM